jgi:hypothetical protein
MKTPAKSFTEQRPAPKAKLSLKVEQLRELTQDESDGVVAGTSLRPEPRCLNTRFCAKTR